MGTELLCPSCTARMVELSPKASANLDIDRCADCDLLWFDSSELAHFLRSVHGQHHVEVDADVPYRSRSEDTLTRCPRCEGELLRPCFLNEAQGHWCVRCFGFLIKESEIPHARTEHAANHGDAQEAAETATALADFLSAFLDRS